MGLFGDALLRKFGAEPPQEWETGVAYLNDAQIERGFRRFVFGWKGGPPSLPDFMRMCRSIGDDTMDDGQPRLLALPAADTRKFDGWDITANIRFWKYITRRLTNEPRAWGAPSSIQQAEATRISVAYKNAWAQDMREADMVDSNTGEIRRLTLEEQAKSFAECMRRAEVDISIHRAGKAA